MKITKIIVTLNESKFYLPYVYYTTPTGKVKCEIVHHEMFTDSDEAFRVAKEKQANINADGHGVRSFTVAK